MAVATDGMGAATDGRAAAMAVVAMAVVVAMADGSSAVGAVP
jgi:hypothetical protein